MLFFDLTNRQSFSKLSNCIENINNSIEIEVPILLVGNRGDSKKFVISPNEITSIIRDFNLFYIETSLTTKEGIYDSFYCITSLTLGIEVDHEYFLSKDIIYYPHSNPSPNVPRTKLLTSQDLSNLSQQAIFKRIESLEKTYEKATQIKIPLKRLLTEVVLSIGVMSLFIIEHFILANYYEALDSGDDRWLVLDIIPGVISIPTLILIKILLFIAVIMQSTVIIPILISFLKNLRKKSSM
jgi:hypothetical protein